MLPWRGNRALWIRAAPSFWKCLPATRSNWPCASWRCCARARSATVPIGGWSRRIGIFWNSPTRCWARRKSGPAAPGTGASPGRQPMGGNCVPSSAQDAVLRDLVAQVPPLDRTESGRPLHPPLRKALLAELGRRDPSLAYRVAAHLWARDLIRQRTTARTFQQAAERWTRGDEWACFAIADAVQGLDGRWRGGALFVPAAAARSLLLLLGNPLVRLPIDHPRLRLE